MQKKNNALYVVVPCYNEQETIENTAKTLKQKLDFLIKAGKIDESSKIYFVDDGSSDSTWKLICNLNKKDNIFTGISLSKNRGHQNALVAGLFSCLNHADLTITIDADLQDDVNTIDEMVDKYNEGCDVVYGVRTSRKTDSFLKRKTALMFYWLMEKLGAKTIPNHADFRLMSKRSVEALKKFEEVNLFLRGVIPLIGFKSGKVYYERKKRKLGKSKYSVSKMIAFAIDGITSFSTKPVKFVFLIGFCLLLLGVTMLTFNFIVFITGNNSFSILSLILTSIWLVGGLNLISIGMIFEYVGKIYLETKKRPRYFIEQNLDCQND